MRDVEHESASVDEEEGMAVVEALGGTVLA